MSRAVRIKNFRMRFEVGQQVPEAGDTLTARSLFAGQKRIIKIYNVRRTFLHEDGATLMDADVSQKDVEA